MKIIHSRPEPSRFEVYLIKPTRYDDQGYPVRYWKGVLPSNTLCCLYGLTEHARREGALPGVDLRVHLLDESVHKISVERLAKAASRKGTRVLACLVGVQTNQFSRARDLALELRGHGITVMVGGFHVSGTLAMFREPTPELRELLEAGVTLVAGEVEEHWTRLLQDAYSGNLQPLYNFLSELPDLRQAPIPLTHPNYLRRFVFRRYATIDTSRGCPYRCSFCTIINVQGRKMRYRSPECVERLVRESYQRAGVKFFFFTDDNFARNPVWEEILDRLIVLRESEGWPIEIMLQVDTLSHRIPRFIEKAAHAGCSNVFIGIESLNPKNLLEADKRQNHLDQYRELIAAWHAAGVSTHASYIIGFPHDTESSVREDLERLITEIQPQRASFFILTPLPGSADHKQMVARGVPLEPDFNAYDSTHVCFPHPHLDPETWRRLYREAWERFYSLENMRVILQRATPKQYWDLFWNFLWYKAAALVEGIHPMMAGLWRIKDRQARRPGYPRESWLQHWRRRIPELYHYVRQLLALLAEMEDLWLQTRRPSATEQRVRARLEQVRGHLPSLPAAWHARARGAREDMWIQLRSRLWSAARRSIDWLLVHGAPQWQSRKELSHFWQELRRQLRNHKLAGLSRIDRVVVNLCREIQLMLWLLLALALRPTPVEGSD